MKCMGVSVSLHRPIGRSKLVQVKHMRVQQPSDSWRLGGGREEGGVRDSCGGVLYLVLKVITCIVC